MLSSCVLQPTHTHTYNHCCNNCCNHYCCLHVCSTYIATLVACAAVASPAAARAARALQSSSDAPHCPIAYKYAILACGGSAGTSSEQPLSVPLSMLAEAERKGMAHAGVRNAALLACARYVLLFCSCRLFRACVLLLQCVCAASCVCISEMAVCMRMSAEVVHSADLWTMQLVQASRCSHRLLGRICSRRNSSATAARYASISTTTRSTAVVLLLTAAVTQHHYRCCYY
jgi:hypothetical protein